MFLGVGEGAELGRRGRGMVGISGEEGEVGEVGPGGWCWTPCTTGRGEYT